MLGTWLSFQLAMLLVCILGTFSLAHGAAVSKPYIAPEQVPAIRAIKSALPSAITKTWGEGAPCRTWLYTTCNSKGQITALVLSSLQNLNGSIPNEIGLLTSLTVLKLDGNQLTGQVPPSFGNLTSLKILSLARNQLSGPFPSSLLRLAQLEMLNLRGNQFTGSLPDSFSSLTSLKSLRLDRNSFTGRFPPSLTKLGNLESLSLVQNQLSGPIPASIGALSSIKILFLSSNLFSGRIPAGIANLTTLTALDLSGNNLFGPVTDELPDLPVLGYLDLSSNQLTGPPPTDFVSPLLADTLLGTYNIGNNYFYGTSPQFIARNNRICPSHQKGGLSDSQGLADFSGSKFGTMRKNCFPQPPRSALLGRSARALAPGSPAPGVQCPSERQRSPLTCLAFCGATTPSGPCGGHGVCFLSGPSSIPTCNCRKGYYRTSVTVGEGSTEVTYESCTRTPPRTPPAPPPSPLPPANPATGLDPASLSLPGAPPPPGSSSPSAFNRYFRHFSKGFVGTAANPAWTYAEYVDWRQVIGGGGLGNESANSSSSSSVLNFVQSVKDQGSCASCWAFAPVSAIESAFAIAYSTPPPNISEQRVLNCQGKWNCEGGVPSAALDYAASFSAPSGIPPESAQPYTATFTPGSCLAKTGVGRRRRLLSLFLTGQGESVWDWFQLESKRGSNPEWDSPATHESERFPRREMSSVSFSGTSRPPPARPPPHLKSPPPRPKPTPPSPKPRAKVPPKSPVKSPKPPARSPPNPPSKGAPKPSAKTPPKPPIKTPSPKRSPPVTPKKSPPKSPTVAPKSPPKSPKVSPKSPPRAPKHPKHPPKSPRHPPKPPASPPVAAPPGLPPTPAPPPPPSSPAPSPSPPSPLPSRFSITMYEAANLNGWLGTLLAVQQQPVIATIEADQQSFTEYTGGFVYNDPGCFSNHVVDHTVTIVGYNLNAPVPYWIIQNSWGEAWGEGGYMRMAITGGDGICGINTYPALYPVVEGPDPCSPINPCGGGLCSPSTSSPSLYNCSYCPDNFLVVSNRDGSQTCAPVQVCAFFSSNPCSVGTCVDDYAGGYSCLCPTGYVNVTNSDGSQACAPGSTPQTITVQAGYTCDIIASLYGLTVAQLVLLNPGLDCSNVPVGSQLSIANSGYSGCSLSYTASAGDTCDSIAALFSTNSSALLAQNPGLDCTTLAAGQRVCLQLGPPSSPICSQTYTAEDGDTCDSVQKYSARPPLSPSDFYALNPGILCGGTSQQQPLLAGQQICVGGSSGPIVGSSSCAYGRYYVARGDSCMSILCRVFHCSTALERKYNPSFSCSSSGLWVGRPLCRAP